MTEEDLQKRYQTAKTIGLPMEELLMIYTQLIDFKSDEYEVQIAITVDEAKKLGEAGFEHYDTLGDKHLYRKRK